MRAKVECGYKELRDLTTPLTRPQPTCYARVACTLPSYRLHKQSGQAIVSLPLGEGTYKDYLLGLYGSEESKQEYARIVTEWQTNGLNAPGADPSADTTINELAWRYFQHAEEYYRRPDGSQTEEVNEYRAALKVLRGLYGATLCRDFGPLQLKTVRNKMIELDWCRSLINKRINRLKRVFRWGAENKLVPIRMNQSGDSNYLQMLEVENLKAGRSAARESDPVRPVPLALVEETLPFMTPTVAAMVETQLLSGARPGEVCRMRGCDLDTTDRIWLYHPGKDHGPYGQHKTAHRGGRRVIAIGPKAQEIIKPFLKLDTEAYLFSPRESRREFDASRKKNRKSPMTPSQAKRRPKKNPQRHPGEYYRGTSYCHAIRRAVDLANTAKACKACKKRKPEERCQACQDAALPYWHPHQLRHTRGTELRRKYGTEAAQAVLGHESLDATELYAEVDLGIAKKIMAEIG
jgi:integrase